jgi:hypothetical protein
VKEGRVKVEEMDEGDDEDRNGDIKEEGVAVKDEEDEVKVKKEADDG